MIDLHSGRVLPSAAARFGAAGSVGDLDGPSAAGAGGLRRQGGRGAGVGGCGRRIYWARRAACDAQRRRESDAGRNVQRQGNVAHLCPSNFSSSMDEDVFFRYYPIVLYLAFFQVVSYLLLAESCFC